VGTKLSALGAVQLVREGRKGMGGERKENFYIEHFCSGYLYLSDKSIGVGSDLKEKVLQYSTVFYSLLQCSIVFYSVL
jgi:hypothetical protein